MHTTTHWIAVFGLVGFMGCADPSDDNSTAASAVATGDFSLLLAVDEVVQALCEAVLPC